MSGRPERQSVCTTSWFLLISLLVPPWDEAFPALPQAMPQGQTSPTQHFTHQRPRENDWVAFTRRWHQRSSWTGAREGLRGLWNRGRSPSTEVTLCVGLSLSPTKRILELHMPNEARWCTGGVRFPSWMSDTVVLRMKISNNRNFP